MIGGNQAGGNSRDWRARLSQSRDLGTGFAAPGGEFTRALYEWSFTPNGKILHSLLKGRRVVELGAYRVCNARWFGSRSGLHSF